MNYKAFLTITLLCIGFLVHSQKPTITFTPHWLPQAQFAGYYMALEKGYYADEGINVEIVHPSASVNAIELLANGEADLISLFLITAISAKNNGVDLVNISQISQNSALLFVSKKESGIEKLSDFNNKSIGVWKSGFDEVGKALMISNNYNVEWVPILSTINLFMVGGIDALTVMWFNEYFQIINAGINPDELNTFLFADYGYNVPEDGLYCLNSTLNQRPDDLKKFLRATYKGWDYAKNNFDETIDVVLGIMKKSNIQTNKSHQTWMLNKVLEMLEVGDKNVRIGELAETDFYKTQSILIDGGYMQKRFGFSDFHQPVLTQP
jgi:NitT/TauT family transport system substrate-binding protein